MPSLKELDLSNTNVKGFTRQISNQDVVLSLAALQDLKQLERFHLDQTPVNDEAAHVLLGFDKLSIVSLNNTLVKDKCMESLSQVKKLMNLSIQGTLLTNGALDLLNPPITVKVLDLRGCWLLTMDSVTLFTNKHPGIEVRHEHISQSSAEHNNLHLNAASSQKGSKASKLKQRDRKPFAGPFSFKEDVLDQRIKYNREELFTLQHLSSPLAPPLNIDVAASKVD